MKPVHALLLAAALSPAPAAATGSLSCSIDDKALKLEGRVSCSVG